MAHPMPGSMVNLFVLEKTIKGEAKIPLIELQNTLSEQQDYANLNSPIFVNYFIAHINAASEKQSWVTVIDSITVIEDTDPIIGKYKEVIVYFELKPPTNVNVRKFVFNYDAVIHQVITHKIIVSIQQDWFNGIQEDHKERQIGIIELDVPSGKYNPLKVNLEEGSWWKGFKGMFNLGMQHIKEGTDHLLFLLVLLLPAMLLVNNKKWGQYGGIKYSLSRLLKIVTAFTIGHSITLLIGALGWVKLPQQPVEVLIAFSILVSAIHTVKPYFPGKETYVAAGFGLVHGLAFATVLSKLKLTAGTMAMSILGFNIGIELMQLFIIAIIIPWLILLSKTVFYKWFKNGVAVLAAIAAIAWIVERTTGKENFVSKAVQINVEYTFWGILILAIASLTIFIFQRKIDKETA